ncbi:MAG: hypothetical protein KJO21_07915 [Verrucomicrobiae bacterium]|nr:hypothetical protein [Verrucomicrobiae bacterium]NNJ43400.1 hypothetical protein [Akkermansiaceae bacterium]
MDYCSKDQTVSALTAIYVRTQVNPTVDHVKKAMDSIRIKLNDWARDGSAIIPILDAYCAANKVVTLSSFLDMMAASSLKFREFRNNFTQF